MPQNVARYADPLVRSVHAWKTTWRNAELVSVDLDDRLFVFDTRPRSAAPISMLTGEDRRLYLACDAIADGSRLEPQGGRRLNAMAERGLMLRDGAKYLSLAVPLGEYKPSGAAAARLRTMFSAAGTPRAGRHQDFASIRRTSVAAFGAPIGGAAAGPGRRARALRL